MIFVSNRKLLIDYTCVEIDKKKRHFAIGAPRVGWWEPARRMGGGGVDSESINCSLQI